MEGKELITKVDPNEFTRIFFTDSEAYSRMTVKCKNDNAFLFTRTISKKYPILANELSNVMNHLVIDFLRKKLVKAHGGFIPKWVFTPLNDRSAQKQIHQSKNKKNAIDKIAELENDLIESYKSAYEIDKHTFGFIVEDNSELLLKDLKKFDKEVHAEKHITKTVKK